MKGVRIQVVTSDGKVHDTGASWDCVEGAASSIRGGDFWEDLRSLKLTLPVTEIKIVPDEQIDPND